MRVRVRGRITCVTVIKGNPTFPSHPEIKALLQPYRTGAGDPHVDPQILDLSMIRGDYLPFLMMLRESCPFGTTTTYGNLARLWRKHPRFIGTIMRNNPFPIFFPCHRVLAKDGIGGYSHGKDLKRELLRHEGILP